MKETFYVYSDALDPDSLTCKTSDKHVAVFVYNTLIDCGRKSALLQNFPMGDVCEHGHAPPTILYKGVRVKTTPNAIRAYEAFRRADVARINGVDTKLTFLGALGSYKDNRVIRLSAPLGFGNMSGWELTEADLDGAICRGHEILISTATAETLRIKLFTLAPLDIFP